MIFEMRNISKKFGGLQALNNVSFSLAEDEILGIIGPNGAGKTTLFNVINGIYKPSSGKIRFNDFDITGIPPNVICHKGIGRTFQVAKPFREMTVLENVMTAAFCRTNSTSTAVERASSIIERCDLAEKAKMTAKNLTTIDQRRLELAKALATEPKMLLLDEIMAGLTIKECEIAITLVRKIREMGLSILMVEHVMKAVMSLCDRILVLDQGRKLTEGTPKEIARNEIVIEAYLGKGGSLC